jgi:primosomal protein N' (replication factor Y)
MDPPGPSLPFVRVVVDLPTRAFAEPLDYSVPESLAGVAHVGAPVVVPLGALKRSGWIVERVAEPSCDPALVKPVRDVSGPPLFDETAARLALWLADRYLAPPSEALRLVLPPGQARRVERWVRLAADPVELLAREGSEAAADAGGSHLMRDLVTWLAAREEAELAEVEDVFGAAGAKGLKRLIASGVVTEDTRLEGARVGAKTEEWAELALPVDEALAAVGGRAAKQRALVDALAKGPGRSADLLAAAKTDRVPLRNLAGKGLVRLERREIERPVDTRWSGAEERGLVLEPEQAAALATLEGALPAGGDRREAGAGDGSPATGGLFCLEGVTGSGKSEVYLRLIESARRRGLGAIVLVPEISLTPQTVGRFSARFGDAVAVLHSRLGPGERFDQWRSLAEGRRQLVVGARSALFAPVRPLGVIVLDEEHDGSFKQESAPRYHAREAAIELGRMTGAVVVLGSATPSLEAMRCVETGAARRLHLSKRVAGRTLPAIEIVDMAREFKEGNRSILSGRLREELERCLGAGEKAIVLINRRGWAGFVLCRDCGFVPKCPACEVSLTVHHGRGRREQGRAAGAAAGSAGDRPRGSAASDDILRCHHCGHSEKMPGECPTCGSAFLRTFGTGTQRVEEVLRMDFPDAPVVRMDADTTRGRRGHHLALESFSRAKSGILVGTQMVAKGHDFPEVSLVGVIAADLALHLPDFRAAERTYQLLHQVAGRAGRGDVAGRVVVQTYCPEHYAISALPAWDLDAFYLREQQFRRDLGYPPYGALVNLLVSGKGERSVADAAEAIGVRLRQAALEHGSVEVLGPVAAPLARLGGHYRRQVLLKGPDGAAMRVWVGPELRTLRAKLAKDVSLAVDVDPLWLM